MTAHARTAAANSRVVAILASLLLSAAAIGCTDDGSAGDQRSVTTSTPASRVSTTTSTTAPPNCDDASTCTTRQLADAAGVTFGTAVDAAHLDEADYRSTLVETFNSVTPENELKWASIHPAPDRWNFGPADQIVEFADENNLQVKGHNLIWDQETVDSTPDWVLDIDDPVELRAVVAEHIRTVMEHYRGTVDRWDVVNEPLQTVGADLYDNHFRQVLGDGYISEMFAIAHEADPRARLFINEVTVELLPAKAAALVALVKDLLARDTPIDGVGIQAHLVAGTIDSAAVARLIDDLEELGVDVAITELDVPTTTAADPLATQADTFGETVGACLEQKCREVTLWGFTDRYTWIDNMFGPGRAPLPFDRNYRPKPALTAIRERLFAAAESSPTFLR